MGLVLSSQDVEDFTALQEALLAPLEYDSVDSWCAAVLRRAEKLFRADRSAMFVPLGNQIHYISESIDPRVLDAFRDGLGENLPGALHFTEDLVDQAWAARRARRIDVWSIPLLARLLGRPMEQVQMYHEAVKPAGLTECAVATTAVPEGEAFLGISHSRPADVSFAEPERLQLMGMLLPALKAGIASVVRLDTQRFDLGRSLDALGDAILMCDAGGRVIHQSRRLKELLGLDPEGSRVLGELRALADSLRSLRSRRSSLSGPTIGAWEARTATARYRLRGTYLGTDCLGLGDAVLVTLERTTPALPSAGYLTHRYGLTARESEIALLLAHGLSNREIARRIGLSPHTVRHHSEWVFAKLAVHSRKALALKLIGDAG